MSMCLGFVITLRGEPSRAIESGLGILGLIGPLQEDTPRFLDSLYNLLGINAHWLLDVLLAIGIIIASWYVGKFVVRAMGRPVARQFERPSLTRVVLQVIRIAVIVVGLLIAAAIVGFTGGEILLSVTVFSAVLAVVLAPIVRRFISGVFVLADRPYEIGDMIELEDTDTRGFVEDVTLRYTKLFTLENTFMVLPNSEIIDRDVINYSAEDERTRQSIELVVTYEGDLDVAREIAQEATATVDDVVGGGPPIRVGSTRYPAKPTCQIDKFGDHGIVLRLRFWVKKPYYLHSVRSAVQTNVWKAFEDAPVEIAYPHNHLVFDEHSGTIPIQMRQNDTDDVVD